MFTHKKFARATRRQLTSVRVRALLSLGVALGVGSLGTLAAWTDSVGVTGTTFTAGSLDLKVNGLNAVTGYTELNIANAVPGSSTAGILTIRNDGLAPMKYTATTTATNLDAKNVRSSLVVKVTGATAATGSSPSATCAGAALPGFAASLTATSFLTPGRLLAPGTEEKICVQVTLDANAPSSVQGGTTDVGFTFTGTSDLT